MGGEGRARSPKGIEDFIFRFVSVSAGQLARSSHFLSSRQLWRCCCQHQGTKGIMQVPTTACNAVVNPQWWDVIGRGRSQQPSAPLGAQGKAILISLHYGATQTSRRPLQNVHLQRVTQISCETLPTCHPLGMWAPTCNWVAPHPMGQSHRSLPHRPEPSTLEPPATMPYMWSSRGQLSKMTSDCHSRESVEMR